VRLAGFEELPPRGVFRDDPHDDAVEEGCLAVILLEALEDEPFLLEQFDRLVRAGADDVLAEPVVRELVVGCLVLVPGLRRDDERTVLGGHGCQEQRLRLGHDELDRRRIDHLNLFVRVFHEAGDDVDRPAAHLQEAREGTLDRIGIARRSVMEHGVRGSLKVNSVKSSLCDHSRASIGS